MTTPRRKITASDLESFRPVSREVAEAQAKLIQRDVADNPEFYRALETIHKLDGAVQVLPVPPDSATTPAGPSPPASSSAASSPPALVSAVEQGPPSESAPASRPKPEVKVWGPPMSLEQMREIKKAARKNGANILPDVPDEEPPAPDLPNLPPKVEVAPELDPLGPYPKREAKTEKQIVAPKHIPDATRTDPTLIGRNVAPVKRLPGEPEELAPPKPSEPEPASELPVEKRSTAKWVVAAALICVGILGVWWLANRDAQPSAKTTEPSVHPQTTQSTAIANTVSAAQTGSVAALPIVSAAASTTTTEKSSSSPNSAAPSSRASNPTITASSQPTVSVATSVAPTATSPIPTASSANVPTSTAQRSGAPAGKPTF